MDKEQVLNVMRKYADGLSTEANITDDSDRADWLLWVRDKVQTAIEAIEKFPEEE